MNKNRRKRLQEIKDGLLEVSENLRLLQDEEQEAFDNLPESIQNSDRGAQMEDAASAICEAAEYVELASDSLDEILS